MAKTEGDSVITNNARTASVLSILKGDMVRGQHGLQVGDRLLNVSISTAATFSSSGPGPNNEQITPATTPTPAPTPLAGVTGSAVTSPLAGTRAFEAEALTPQNDECYYTNPALGTGNGEQTNNMSWRTDANAYLSAPVEGVSADNVAGSLRLPAEKIDVPGGHTDRLFVYSDLAASGGTNPVERRYVRTQLPGGVTTIGDRQPTDQWITYQDPAEVLPFPQNDVRVIVQGGNDPVANQNGVWVGKGTRVVRCVDAIAPTPTPIPPTPTPTQEPPTPTPTPIPPTPTPEGELYQDPIKPVLTQSMLTQIRQSWGNASSLTDVLAANSVDMGPLTVATTDMSAAALEAQQKNVQYCGEVWHNNSWVSRASNLVYHSDSGMYSPINQWEPSVLVVNPIAVTENRDCIAFSLSAEATGSSTITVKVINTATRAVLSSETIPFAGSLQVNEVIPESVIGDRTVMIQFELGNGISHIQANQLTTDREDPPGLDYIPLASNGNVSACKQQFPRTELVTNPAPWGSVQAEYASIAARVNHPVFPEDVHFLRGGKNPPVDGRFGPNPSPLCVESLNHEKTELIPGGHLWLLNSTGSGISETPPNLQGAGMLVMATTLDSTFKGSIVGVVSDSGGKVLGWAVTVAPEVGAILGPAALLAAGIGVVEGSRPWVLGMMNVEAHQVGTTSVESQLNSNYLSDPLNSGEDMFLVSGYTNGSRFPVVPEGSVGSVMLRSTGNPTGLPDLYYFVPKALAGGLAMERVVSEGQMDVLQTEIDNLAALRTGIIPSQTYNADDRPSVQLAKEIEGGDIKPPNFDGYGKIAAALAGGMNWIINTINDNPALLQRVKDIGGDLTHLVRFRVLTPNLVKLQPYFEIIVEAINTIDVPLPGEFVVTQDTQVVWFHTINDEGTEYITAIKKGGVTGTTADGVSVTYGGTSVVSTIIQPPDFVMEDPNKKETYRFKWGNTSRTAWIQTGANPKRYPGAPLPNGKMDWSLIEGLGVGDQAPSEFIGQFDGGLHFVTKNANGDLVPIIAPDGGEAGWWIIKPPESDEELKAYMTPFRFSD